MTFPAARVRRTLSLRTGLLEQEIGDGAHVLRAVQFSSLDRPGTVALRAKGPARWLRGAPLAGTGAGRGKRATDCVQGRAARAAPRSRPRRSCRRRACSSGSPSTSLNPGGPLTCAEAREALAAAERDGWESLLSHHRAAWARRWQTADVSVPGNDELTLAVRFALYHLMASAGSSGGDGNRRAGADRLSAYSGHVFWDTDVFVLPFLAALTHPPPRAVLEYRLRRLDAARLPRGPGRAGARFAWESAAEGST